MKTMRLKVTPAGQVKVSAPFSVTDRDIISMIESRLSWIHEQQQAYAHSPRAEAEQATEQDRKEWAAVVKACVPPLVESWESVLGVKVEKLVYRNMSSRWGSCQPSTGKVCINTRLALYPPECLEYVVLHELCHFLVPNHGSEFKALLDRLMPDWRDRANKLRY